MSIPSPLILLILDGWGYSEEKDHNAIATANTAQWDEWWANCPHMLLNASGSTVGLPDNQMGNSEVGHMHLGAGRPVPQDFTRINQAIEDGTFFENPIFNTCIDELKNSGNALHVFGLLSDGGVHSHEKHLFALLKYCAQKDFNKVSLHLFLDGRDTPPQSALESINRLNEALKAYPVGKIASISGRYYAMDRDERWERIKPVYDVISAAKAEQHYPSAEDAIKDYYQSGLSDEFIPPTHINEGQAIADGDAVFFFNFRSDRARQLSRAFVEENFSAFKRQWHPKLSFFLSMTQYAQDLNTKALFPPQKLNNTLGQVVSDEGLCQLRIAETEKYAHVTFFFNGGAEHVFEDEDRILIPSPRVSTYDLKPEMSALELTSAIIDAIQSESYDLIICNFANADMVGHTGSFSATVKAIECLDNCMAKIWQVLKQHHGQLLITADHGNAEKMYDHKTSQAHTAHTSRPVPLLYIGSKDWQFKKQEGSLIDVAPTVLTLLDIEQPSEMTGQSLMEKRSHE
jgi:2,3-bisphosphoglycerate-independent phosphoglycerate mutase